MLNILKCESATLEFNMSKVLDRNALQKELTQGFIYFMYHQEHPCLHAPTTKSMIDMYHNSPVVHAKVQTLVAGVMQIVDKHVTPLEEES